MELLRILFDVPKLWMTTFNASFGKRLTPRERLALPGQATRTRWTGGDATKSFLGAIDWGHGHLGPTPAYLGTEAEPLKAQLHDVLEVPRGEKGWIIAVVELLVFIVLATIRGLLWQGELVFYVTYRRRER